MVECWPRNLAVVGSNPTQDSSNVVVFYNYISSFIVYVQPITGLVHFSLPVFLTLILSVSRSNRCAVWRQRWTTTARVPQESRRGTSNSHSCSTRSRDSYSVHHVHHVHHVHLYVHLYACIYIHDCVQGSWFMLRSKNTVITSH